MPSYEDWSDARGEFKCVKCMRQSADSYCTSCWKKIHPNLASGPPPGRRVEGIGPLMRIRWSLSDDKITRISTVILPGA